MKIYLFFFLISFSSLFSQEKTINLLINKTIHKDLLIYFQFQDEKINAINLKNKDSISLKFNTSKANTIFISLDSNFSYDNTIKLYYYKDSSTTYGIINDFENIFNIYFFNDNDYANTLNDLKRQIIVFSNLYNNTTFNNISFDSLNNNKLYEITKKYKWSKNSLVLLSLYTVYEKNQDTVLHILKDFKEIYSSDSMFSELYINYLQRISSTIDVRFLKELGIEYKKTEQFKIFMLSSSCPYCYRLYRKLLPSKKEKIILLSDEHFFDKQVKRNDLEIKILKNFYDITYKYKIEYMPFGLFVNKGDITKIDIKTFFH